MADRKGQGIAAGALDEPSEDDDENDALDELKTLAAEERRRNPKLSKARPFTKVYTDPANAKLAQRERRRQPTEGVREIRARFVARLLEAGRESSGPRQDGQ